MINALDFEGPEEQFLTLKQEAGYPGEYIEELFLLGKTVTDEDTKNEIRLTLEQNAPKDVFKAFKNRKKFPEVKAYNWQKFIEMLLKYAKLSPSLDIGKMHLLLGGTELRCVSNSKAAIPKEAGRFTTAKVLSIISDFDHPIPEELSQLKNLETIFIRGKKIPKLPSGFKALPKLKELNFNIKGCDAFPIDITQYQQLEILKLNGGDSYCRTTFSIPSGLNQLSNLKKLSLAYWDVQSLPDDLFRMPQLVELQIAQLNKLESLPVSMGHLKSLKTFKFYILSENFKSFPKEIGNCQELESLDIGGLPNLETLDPAIFTSPHLKNISLRLQGNFDPSKVSGLSSPIQSIRINNLSTFSFIFQNPELFSNLQTVSIENIKEDFQLPSIQNQFPSLKELKINCKPDALNHLNTYTNLAVLEIVLSEETEVATFPVIKNLSELEHLSVRNGNVILSTSDLPNNSFTKLVLGTKEIHFDHQEALRVEEMSLFTNKIMLDSAFNINDLKSLSIHGIALQEVPDIFGACPSLTKLDIQGNFQTLPDSIGQLSALKRFKFDGNLKMLPDSFGDLINLEYISILTGNTNMSKKASQVLEYIPDTFSKLKSLKHFEITAYLGKNYEAIFSGLTQLKRLKLVRLENFETIPASFAQLTKLEELIISSCENFETIGEVLPQLPALKVLRLMLCHCKEEEFINITKITQLEHFQVLGWNNLTKIPIEISNLKNLDTLMLTSLNTVDLIPDSIGDLENLVVLSVGGHQITTLPERLTQLSKLKVLAIGSCRFEQLPDKLEDLNLEYFVYHLSKFGGNNMKREKYAILLKPFTKHIENMFHADLYGTYVRRVMGEE